MSNLKITFGRLCVCDESASIFLVGISQSKTMKPRHSLAALYACNNRAENKPFNNNFITGQLNSNNYNMIEINKIS